MNSFDILFPAIKKELEKIVKAPDFEDNWRKIKSKIIYNFRELSCLVTTTEEKSLIIINEEVLMNCENRTTERDRCWNFKNYLLKYVPDVIYKHYGELSNKLTRLLIMAFDLPIDIDLLYESSSLKIPNLLQFKAQLQQKETIMTEPVVSTEKTKLLTKLKNKTKSHSLEIAKRTAAKKIAKQATKPIVSILKSLKVDNPFIYSMLETEQGAAFVGSMIGLAAPWLPIQNQKIKKLVEILSDELQIQGGQVAFEQVLGLITGPFINEFSKNIESLMNQVDIKQLVGSTDPVGDEIKKRVAKKKIKKVRKTVNQDENILVKDVITV